MEQKIINLVVSPTTVVVGTPVQIECDLQADGAPFTLATIWLVYAATGDRIASDKTDANGHFKLSQIINVVGQFSYYLYSDEHVEPEGIIPATWSDLFTVTVAEVTAVVPDLAWAGGRLE